MKGWKRPLRRLKLRWKKILKWMLMKYVARVGMGLILYEISDSHGGEHEV
jgi:hypothetical protein